jgi:hypothetical protein
VTEQKITRVESALKYDELGFCIIPVRPRSKEAAIEWKDYHQLKKPKPTIDEIKSWLIGSENNFAVIYGKVSGSFEIDIDGDEGKQRFEQVFPKFNPNLQSAIRNTMRLVSSNGQKIIFKYRPEEWPEGISTIKDLWKGDGKHNGIELRGNGCYSLGVGSVHPDGTVYSLAYDSEFNPLTLTQSEIEELVDVIAGDSFAAGGLRINYSGAANNGFNDEITPLGPLDDEIIDALAANAKKYFVDGSKNDFTLGLCGVLRKMGVSYNDVYKLEYLIDPADSKNLNRVKYIFNHNGPLAGKGYLIRVLAGQGLNQFQIPKAVDELLGKVELLRKKKGEDQCKEEGETPIVVAATVSDAERKHSGRISVSGRTISSSDLYQLVKKAVWKCFVCGAKMERKVVKITEPPLKPKQCPYCDNNPNADFEDLHDYVNAITVVIQDDVPEAPLDGLPVIVFEEYTGEIHVGENIKIIGKVEKVQDKRSKKYHSVLLAEEIEYEHRRKLVLTNNDIEVIKRFAGKIPLYRSNGLYLQNPAKRLVKMFAPNVVGYEDKKLAILLSMVGAPEKKVSVEESIS